MQNWKCNERISGTESRSLAYLEDLGHTVCFDGSVPGAGIIASTGESDSFAHILLFMTTRVGMSTTPRHLIETREILPAVRLRN